MEDGKQQQNSRHSSDRSVGSDGSVRSTYHRLRPSGGYRALRSFRTTTLIYDATVAFCERFLDPRSRTVDQMVQAARSGRQNIGEGSRASAVSSQTELRLVSVARSSLDELLLDYEDFLAQRGLRIWDKDSPDALAVRAIGKTLENRMDQSDRSDRSDAAEYARWLTQKNPEIIANTLICLIHQANYLLDRQIAELERCFIEDGGYTEKLATARVAHRARKYRTDQSDPTDPSDHRPNAEAPACPLCGEPLVLRTARKGPRAGAQFWGCSGYPACRGTREL